MITPIQLRKIEKNTMIIGNPINPSRTLNLTKGKEYRVFGFSKTKANKLIGVKDDSGINMYYSPKNFDLKL